MIAQVCGLGLGDFVHTIGDAHLYLNHVEQAKLQLTREPFPLPTMKINPDIHELFDKDGNLNFKFEDFELQNYQCHPTIKAPIAV